MKSLKNVWTTLISIKNHVLLGIYSFFINLSIGLKKAENQAFNVTSTDVDGVSVDVTKGNLGADLIKGEVTQRVKELRHEMYYAERKSHEYEYIGNGLAKKRENKLTTFNDKFENPENLPIIMAVTNKEDTGGLSDNLVDVVVGSKDKREYTIKIDRDFIPKYGIEKYTSILVIKELNEIKYQLDFYIPLYDSQFDRKKRPFLNELEKIYDGFVRSEIVDFKGVNFVTYNTLGSDDLVKYDFGVDFFLSISKYDGNYVLKFIGYLKDKHDIITEFYDAKYQEKSDNHTPRENVDISLVQVLKDEYNVDKAMKTMNDLL